MSIVLSKNVSDPLKDKKLLNTFKSNFMNRIFIYYYLKKLV